MASKELAEVYGGPHEAPHSLFATIEDGWKNNLNEIAVISTHQPHDLFSGLVQDCHATNGRSNSDESLAWTYAQLHRAALKFAAGLRAHGVEPGMRIATICPNGVQFPLALWTCMIMRLTLCPLDPGAVSRAREEELAKYMSLIQPDAVLVMDERATAAVDVALSKEPKVKIVLDPGFKPESSSRWTSLLQLATSATFSPADEESLLNSARNEDSPTRLASILFTSGTSSGNPKGCPRSVASTTHHLTSQIYGNMTASGRILIASMNFRGIAMSLTMHSLRLGAAIVIADPSAGIAGQIEAIRRHKVTYAFFVPAQLHTMIAHPDFRTSDVSSIESAGIGGDIVTRDLLEKARMAFPHTLVTNSAGMTEGGGIISWPFGNTPVSQLPLQGEIVPLGTATHGARLRIRDPETGQTNHRDEPGEFCISCEGIIEHYLDNVQPEAFFTDCQGHRFFRTGDLAVIDEDDVVTIIGRIKDVVKRAGVPLAPAAIESCIQNFTGAQVSVVAWPHVTLGAEPMAILDGMHGKTQDEIKQEVLSRFGEAYTMGPIVTLKQLGLEEFPSNATGKIMKFELLNKAKEVYSSK
ncbi:4-coumarate-- ligase 2 [Lecanosticta acicola]|uniref:4-coumarate-- ligase 2 n=1 Tax=Lecanosticta acicola TaxID=111012 RepID=A0AAI8YS21_9PEZI|nr:4-coumarate-- ligase 2 [Lecanosticta acicola]